MQGEFTVHRYEVGTCSFCSKDEKEGFVVTCLRGTMQESLLCVSDFKKLLKARKAAKPTAAGDETVRGAAPS
jgi:hypothetical protein